MTGAGGADWVGCLVLTIAPQPQMARVADGVHRAEIRIFNDPVLADTARVASTRSADPLAGDLDEVADRVYRELIDWALSPARNPAPKTTFCLLVLHPDVQQAGLLVRKLAGTSTLSRLPVRFEVRVLRPSPTDASGLDDGDEVARLILEAAAETATSLDQARPFWLTRAQLERLPSRPADRPSPRPAVDTRNPPARPTGTVELAWETVGEPDTVDDPPARAAEGGLPAYPQTTPAAGRDAAPDGDHGGDARDRSALGRLAESARSLFSRREVPANNVEVIQQLSGRTDQVSMLYLVSVSEPIRPARRDRDRRTAVAMGLTRALQAPTDTGGAEPWFVRAFTADGRLRPAARPLPRADQLRPKDFPERWGEHFVLFDCVDDLMAAIDRDGESFVRRGGSKPDTVVVFLAGKPPTISANRDQPFARLCAAALTVWVSFGVGIANTIEESSDRRLHFLSDHEDLVAHLYRVVLDQVRAP